MRWAKSLGFDLKPSCSPPVMIKGFGGIPCELRYGEEDRMHVAAEIPVGDVTFFASTVAGKDGAASPPGVAPFRVVKCADDARKTKLLSAIVPAAKKLRPGKVLSISLGQSPELKLPGSGRVLGGMWYGVTLESAPWRNEGDLDEDVRCVTDIAKRVAHEVRRGRG
jgi:hypothetical protein